MKGRFLVVGLLAVLAIGCGGGKTEESSKPAAAVQPAQQGGQAGGTGGAQGSTQGGAQGGARAEANGTYTVAGAESNAQYSVKEKFLNQELPVTAVGKTSAITGTLVLANGAFQPSKVTVDVRTLKSDRDRRDGVLKDRGLESNKYPTAEFSITGVEGAAPAWVEGQEVAFKLKGNLKVHGVEKAMVWDARGKLQGSTLNLAATIRFTMKDFGIEPPHVAGTLTVDENVQLDVQLVARKG